MGSRVGLLQAVVESEKVLHTAVPVFEAASLGIVLGFWQRLIENSRSISLLLQNNFINEAMVVHRLSIEHFGVIVALLEGKTTLKDLGNKDVGDLPKQARRLQANDSKKSVLTPENRDALNSFVKQLEENPAESSGVNVYNLLYSCGLEHIYINYCLYSLRAAHSTLLSGTSVGTAEEAERLMIDVIDILSLVDAYVLRFVNLRKAQA